MSRKSVVLWTVTVLLVAGVSFAAPRVLASSVFATLFTGEAGSGSNAFAVSTNGAFTDFGAGATDRASSDGTTVTFESPLATSSSLTATTGFKTTYSDQSADCDNAATANTYSGRICIQAGQGSMTLTNSVINTTTIVLLTNVSDDVTCLSGYVTAGTDTATIGCVGAATATANTVMNFALVNGD